MRHQKRQKTPAQQKRTLLILAVIAVAALIFGMVKLSDLKTLEKKCTEQTSGTVVEIYRSRRGVKTYRRTVYSAETVYQVDSVPYRVTSGYRNSTFNYGDKLTVCYNPENPAESYVSEAKPDSGAANIIFGAVVLVFTLVGWQRLRRETSDSGDTLADSESEFDFD